jgi:hypothetical protein
MGATAPAEIKSPTPQIVEPPAPRLEPKLQMTAPISESTQLAAVTPPAPATASTEKLQNAVLQALADGNQRILVSMLEAGEWSVEGNEVVIKISESQTVVDMSLSSEARRLAIASASGILGRAVKLKIVPGASVAPPEKRNGNSNRSTSVSSGAGGRNRAEQDAVVQRLREKFGAEIRTVIDYKERR